MFNLKSDSKTYVVLLSAFFFFLLFLPSGSSQELVYKQNQEISLIRTCFNNETFCSNSAVCNSTVIDPSGLVIVNNTRENNYISYHNLTIRSGLTSELGEYTVIRTCTDTGGDISGNGAETYGFLVTPSGDDDSSAGSFILIGFSFLLAGGLVWFGFNKQDPTTVILGGFILVLLGLFTLLNGLGNYRNDLTQWGSLSVMLIGGYFSVRTSMEMMNVI